MAEDIFNYTVNVPGSRAMKGRYLATRRSDGALFTEIKLNGGKIRKFVPPNQISNIRTEWEPRYIDKKTDL